MSLVDLDAAMNLLALQLALLPLLACVALWIAASAIASRRRVLALRRELLDVADRLGGGAIDEDAIVITEEEARIVARIERRAGWREALTVTLDLHEGASVLAASDYRTRPRAEPRPRPFRSLHPGSPAARRFAWIGRARVLLLEPHRILVRPATTGDDLAPLLADPRFRKAIPALFEAGAARIDLGDGAPTLRATVPRLRSEHLNAFAVRELVTALRAAAAALPIVAHAPRPRLRVDAVHLLAALALPLAILAPLGARDALTRWPILLPDGARLPSLAYLGAAIGALTAILSALALRAGARLWPSTWSRARITLATLAIALPATGATLAVALNAHLDRWTSHYHHGPLDEALATPGERFSTYHLHTTHEAAPGHPLRATLTRSLLAPDLAERCPTTLLYSIRAGFFGAEWLEVIGCASDPLPHPAPPRRMLPPPATLKVPFGIVHAGVVPEKPPLAVHLFDVRLQNQETIPRWFLLPDRLDPDDAPMTPGRASVRSTSVAELDGEGSIPIVTLHGAGLQALLLPAQSDVVIRRLQIETRLVTPRSSLRIVVIVARDLRWDGAPFADRFERVLLASSGANVRDCRNGLDDTNRSCSTIGLKDPGDDRAGLVTFDELRRLREEVPLDEAAQPD